MKNNNYVKSLFTARRAKVGVYFILAIMLGLNTACQSTESKSTADWAQQMQQLKSKFMSVMTLAFDNKRFYEESESKNNLKIIKEFADTAHNMDPAKAKEIMGQDPMVAYTLHNLNELIATAGKSFTDGHKSYSQTLLRHSVSACVQCHTRSKLGPQFFDAKAFGELKVDTMTKADILTATRNIADAQATLEAYLLDPSNKDLNAFYRDKAIKKYLALTLRFEEKPKQAEEFLNRLSKVNGLNQSEVQKITAWKQSLQKWWRETSDKNFQGLRFRENDQQNLFSNADMSEDKYIDNLRQAVNLHKELQTKTANRSKVYLALGNIYDQLAETTYWEIPEVYFEACIRASPNSLTAKSCFYRYQSRMVFGYTGSSGTLIPSEEIKKLNELKKVAGINR